MKPNVNAFLIKKVKMYRGMPFCVKKDEKLNRTSNIPSFDNNALTFCFKWQIRKFFGVLPIKTYVEHRNFHTKSVSIFFSYSKFTSLYIIEYSYE